LLALAPVAATGAGHDEAAFPRFELGWELKLHVRNSRGLVFETPDWLLDDPYAQGARLETPDPGTAAELSVASLTVDALLAPTVRGHARLAIGDLYARNPTSRDQEVVLREAWLLLGDRRQAWRSEAGGPFYLLAGKAPRFTRNEQRRLESYGLWGVAVGWLEQVQLQLGGDLSRHLYWRLHWAVPNPLYMRDTNALAGDVGATADGPLGSGFPILYETAAPDVWNARGGEIGAGIGFRAVSPATRNGVDALVWQFERDLADRVEIEGSRWRGELALLEAAGLPYEGRRKREQGVNLEARVAGLRAFGQLVRQSLGGLERSGYEVEVAYWVPLPGLFAWGDSPVGNWIQPAVRYSEIDNDFSLQPPVALPAAISLVWDWTKLDVGIRFGIVRGVDLTVEFARHDMILLSGARLHPDEMLATLRFAS